MRVKVSKKGEPSKTSAKAVQTELFTDRLDSGLPKGGGTSRRDQRMGLFSRLEEQRTLTMSTMDSVSEPLHLHQAFKRVRDSGGSAGIDGVTPNDHVQNLSSRINSLQQRLDSGTYEPSAVRGVEIEKPTGGTRLLGIPTVEGRIVQQSIRHELQRIFDPYFSENSFGFRPAAHRIRL
jgi:RNA-directed DNA polymerase